MIVNVNEEQAKKANQLFNEKYKDLTIQMQMKEQKISIGMDIKLSIDGNPQRVNDFIKELGISK